jgi:hypothetical protein
MADLSDTEKLTRLCKKCGSRDRYAPNAKGHVGRCKKCWRERSVRNNKLGYGSTTKRAADYQARNPEKYRAHYLVRSAIKSGKLPKVSTTTCEDCGVQAQVYHHENYSKPLEVNALCQVCHMKRHAT